MATKSKALTSEDLRKIDNALRRLADLQEEIAVAEKGGEDVTDYRQMREHMIAEFSRMRAAHFPRARRD